MDTALAAVNLKKCGRAATVENGGNQSIPDLEEVGC